MILYELRSRESRVILKGLGALPDRSRPPTTFCRGGDNDDRCAATAATTAAPLPLLLVELLVVLALWLGCADVDNEGV
jgi:hypothetical protein